MKFLKRFWSDKKAEMTKIISVCIALFVAGILLPIALTQIAGGNYTGVDPAVKTIVTVLLPVLAVISMIYVFMKKKG